VTAPSLAGHAGLEAASIEGARRALAQAFQQHGLDTPELDARLLVGHALALDHTALAAQSDRKLTAAEAGAISTLAARRLAREPVARIVGEKEFWGLTFRLAAETLVPRPETETVVEAALAALGGGERGARRVVDLGTGSGALLLARCAAPARTPRRSARRDARRSSPATTGRRCAGRSTSSCPTLLMSGAATSRCWPQRCACSIRRARSTAVPTGSTAIGRSRRTCSASFHPVEFSWWSSAPDNSPRWRRSLPVPASRSSRRETTSRACPGRLS
jgi:PrmC N-terminal domain